MKSFAKYFGVVAGMAALIVSCNKPENITMPETDTVEMTIIAGSDETKTVLGANGAVTWSDNGEKLSVIEQSYVGETPTVAKATSKDGVFYGEGAKMSFGVTLTTNETADSFNYYALYPNSADVTIDNTNVENFKVQLVSTQKPTATSFGPEADILVSKAVIGKTKQPDELRLQFARVIAVGKMTIKNLNTTENVKKVTFTATDKPVTGISYINLTNATAPEGYGYSPTDNVVLDYSGKEILANEMTAYFTCWPFEIAAEESFSVVVETENYIFTRENVTIPKGKSLVFNAGRATGFNVSFDGIAGVEKKTTVTKTISDISGKPTNGTQVSSMKLDDNITLIASSDGNNGKVYSNGAEWRFYQTNSGKLTISAKEGCTLVSASITFSTANSGILEYNSNTVSSGTSVSLSGSTAVFSVSDTAASTDNGQVKITAITVTYLSGSSEGGSSEGGDTPGEVKTYQHVFTAKPSTGDKVDLSDVNWKIAATNLYGYNSQMYAGVQFGSSSKDGQITLTSPSAWSYTKDGVTVTKIKEVRLWLNLGGTSVTPSVTIGDVAATSDGTKVTMNKSAGSDWTKATKVTFTPAADSNTGVIVIDVTSVKAGYICAIEIDAE